MNRITFWKLRKIVLNVVFWIKKSLFRLFDFFTRKGEYKSFKETIIKLSVIELIKGVVFSVVIVGIDHLLLKRLIILPIDKNYFVPSIIGGIGIAGVILGLYCSNVATIYASRYANAPRIIANAFQFDSLTRSCVSGIVDYIAYGFTILAVTMIKAEISWIVVVASLAWSVDVIISYSKVGNRAYQLSDIYGLADDSNRILCRIITKRLNHTLFATDTNFQNHFMKVAEKQIDLLKSIQKYGDNEKRSDYTTLAEYMCKNLAVIAIYWNNKKQISRTSMWFRGIPKYQKWHLTSDAESSVALQTGTLLRAKEEHDYWWFENELFSINKAGIYTLVKAQDYSSLYTYFLAFDRLCKIAIKCGEANCYVTHGDWLRKTLEKTTPKDILGEEERKAFAGLVEAVSLLYLNLILEASKMYQEFDFQSNIAPILKSIDTGNSFDKNLALRGRDNKEYYEKIITEVQVEGKRITPNWVVEQQIAKEEYVYLNSLLDIVREGMDQAFSLGKAFSEKGLFFEACIIFTRFYEYESKLSRLIEVANYRKAELEEYRIDKAMKWDDWRLNKLEKTMLEWKKTIPELLSNCSSHFALDNWNNNEDYPDFLGESYNHICDDAVDAIIKGDISQFAVDYENLSKLMLLYQAYIRSDFVKKDNLYRVEYAYYMFTSPIVEWAQIGGLAVLWGEFHADSEWKKCVCHAADTIFMKDGEISDLPEKLIEYVQHRNEFMFGIGSRDILETGWQLDVANAIRETSVCEHENGIYGRVLKTDSKLLKCFCPDFIDLGFTTDTSEVFWVTCVNPYLAENKRFQTNYSWDEEM